MLLRFVAKSVELSVCSDLVNIKKEFDTATAIEINRLIHLVGILKTLR